MRSRLDLEIVLPKLRLVSILFNSKGIGQPGNPMVRNSLTFYGRPLLVLMRAYQAWSLVVATRDIPLAMRLWRKPVKPGKSAILLSPSVHSGACGAPNFPGPREKSPPRTAP